MRCNHPEKVPLLKNCNLAFQAETRGIPHVHILPAIIEFMTNVTLVFTYSFSISTPPPRSIRSSHPKFLFIRYWKKNPQIWPDLNRACTRRYRKHLATRPTSAHSIKPEFQSVPCDKHVKALLLLRHSVRCPIAALLLHHSM